MNKESIEKIIELTPANRFSINSFEYSDKKLHLIQSPNVEHTFRVYSLDSIIDYIESEIDSNANIKKLFINVESYKKVTVASELSQTLGRSIVLSAEIHDRFKFNEFNDPEMFNIALQTCFLDTDERKKVLKIARNISDEILQTNKDTGIAQSVTIKSGIQHLDKVELPNPVTLCAMRTFPEIEPFAEMYILRAKKSQTGICMGLFEYDSLGSQAIMINKIKKYLKENLPEYTVI